LPMCSNQKTRTRNKRRIVILLLVWVALSPGNRALAQVPPPSQYGRVTLDKYSSKAGLGPVVFDHWLHRAKFTCRLCHVDIGFAMQANASDIKARTNKEGFHCGACHDGKRSFTGEPVFAACSDTAPSKQCARCHSADKAARKYDYGTFTAKFPKNAYGVDWEEAEATGQIKPIDFLEGLSIRKAPLKSQADFSIQARVTWVSDIIFSHKKHTVWNGCEVCHPEIFPATQKGVTRYTMFHISAGQYCGVCHGKVAFSTNACSSCHKNMQDKESLRDVVVMPAPAKASGFGAVKFMHKSHVGERNVKCETCHHPLKAGSPQNATEQVCSSCHTKAPLPPVKTTLQAAFHNPGATAGTCIDCHKAENAKNFNNDIEFVRSLLPRHQGTIDIAKAQLVYGKDPQMRQLAQEIVRDQQSEIDQMQLWLKQHESASWAPVKCRDCHKKANSAN
jgi:c(7)-type cytochrome triheme protein